MSTIDKIKDLIKRFLAKDMIKGFLAIDNLYIKFILSIIAIALCKIAHKIQIPDL